MSSWGNKDNAANAPYWAINSALTTVDAQPVGTRPTAANVALLYGNTTPNVYTTNETVGLFLVDAAEEQVQEAGSSKPPHSGWNLKVTGSGGRAGRVHWETLVALANVTTDNNSDDSTLADAIITIGQPVTLSGPISAASANTITLSVAGTTVVPPSAALTYQWQVNNNQPGGTWVNIDTGNGVTTGQPGDMIKTGANTATLVLDPTAVTANNFLFRAVVTATNPGITNSSATAYSANARILISA
jgi:hypothetical protein